MRYFKMHIIAMNFADDTQKRALSLCQVGTSTQGNYDTLLIAEN